MNDMLRQHKKVKCPLCRKMHTVYKTFSYAPGDFISKWGSDVAIWRDKQEFCGPCTRRLKG